MRTFSVIAVVVCLAGLQINCQYLEYSELQPGELYAEESRYPSQTYTGYGSNNNGGIFKHGYKGGSGGYGKQNYGSSNYGSRYGKGQNYGGSGTGGFSFGAGGKGQYHGHNKGYGSGYGMVGSTHEMSSYEANEAPKEYISGCGDGCVGSSQGGASYVSAKGYSNGCEGGCGSNQGESSYDNKELSHVGDSTYSDGKGEDVGAANTGPSKSTSEGPGRSHGHDHSQSHVIPGPAYTYSYPSPPPQVKCGHNLLISCNPSSQVVPCSSYSPPAYGSYH